MTHLKKANQLFKLGNYENAINHYELALKENSPVKKQILFNIAIAKKKSNNRKSSGQLKTLQKAIHNNKDCATKNIKYYDKNHPAAHYLLNHQVYTIDIIIPVYNALEDVKNCLNALAKNTDNFQVKAIIVNDFSNQETTSWLRSFCKKNTFCKLIEHKENKGYTKAINSGFKDSQADYIVTLNSDTIVTNGWLKSLVRCIRSDEKIGIVGPLSNAASWQNVPYLLDKNKQFSVNEIPLGLSPDEMAAIVYEASHRVYPRVPFVNGFCFMISREVVNAIGILDEEAFPTGYGEENDYCIRAADAGFELAIADDAYVFHAKSKSFGHEKRETLSKQGSETLKLKHGFEKYSSLVDKIKDTSQLDKVRHLIANEIKKHTFTSKTTTSFPIHQLKILFLLPVKGGGGGAHSVVQEVEAMQKIGVNAKIAIKEIDIEKYQHNYAHIRKFENVFVPYKSNDELVSIASHFNVVIATIFKSVNILKKIITRFPNIMPAYYIQDYEPNFFEPGSADYKIAYDSYLSIPNIYCFAKTEWIIKKVEDSHGIKVNKVSPSIDHTTYKPHSYKEKKLFTISAMIRPQTPYRGAARSMRVLQDIKNKHGSNVEVKIFGCEKNNEFLNDFLFDYQNYGILKREEVSTLLASSDLFLDLSDYQAFGRTALEAMACGCATIITKYGGIREYSRHRENTILVDPFDETSISKEIEIFIKNPAVLSKIKNTGLLTASDYNPHKAAISELYNISNSYSLFNQNKANNLTRLALLPSMRGDGQPAGSGYVRVVLPYTHPKVTESFVVTTHSKKPIIEEHDIFLIQRDADFLSFEALVAFVQEIKEKNKKIVYEIDDDLLNREGMLLRGYKKDHNELIRKVKFIAQSADKITVSTNKLKEIMLAYNNNVIIVPNCLDEMLWKIKDQALSKEKNLAKKDGKTIKIGYIGTQTHQKDLDIIADAVKEIQNKYKNQVTVEVIGAYQNLKPKFGNRVSLPKNTDYPSFVDWLFKRVDWDIGLIPLVEDDFNLSKSNLKFLEYSSLGIAIIASDISTYKDIAKNNVNCLLAKNTTESWFKAIEDLVVNPEKLNMLSFNSYNDVKENYTLINNSTTIILENVLT